MTLTQIAELDASLSQGTFSASGLGQKGRFGNQVIQYMFVRTYAWRHQLNYEIPPWIGNYLYGLNDPPISRQRPPVHEKDEHGVDDTIIPRSKAVFAERDLIGYFQYHSSYFAPYREQLIPLFTPTGEAADQVVPGWERIRAAGKTTVGLHIRRGDYGYSHFYLTPTSWYLRWLDEIWPTLDDPVLFIATDDTSVLADFAKYRPLSCADMQCELPRAAYYPDFYALSQCDVLAMPNSTFPFSAAMLNRQLKLSVRSWLPTQSFVPFDPWNDRPLYMEHNQKAYPDIPGTFHPPAPRPSYYYLRRLKWAIEWLLTPP